MASVRPTTKGASASSGGPVPRTSSYSRSPVPFVWSVKRVVGVQHFRECRGRRGRRVLEQGTRLREQRRVPNEGRAEEVGDEREGAVGGIAQHHKKLGTVRGSKRRRPVERVRAGRAVPPGRERALEARVGAAAALGEDASPLRAFEEARGRRRADLVQLEEDRWCVAARRAGGRPLAEARGACQDGFVVVPTVHDFVVRAPPLALTFLRRRQRRPRQPFQPRRLRRHSACRCRRLPSSASRRRRPVASGVLALQRPTQTPTAKTISAWRLGALSCMLMQSI